jgi:hypothetical protein
MVLKHVLIIIATFGAIAGMYYLYQRQFGAISFFILSTFFFYLAYQQLSKARKEQKDDSIKKD